MYFTTASICTGSVWSLSWMRLLKGERRTEKCEAESKGWIDRRREGREGWRVPEGGEKRGRGMDEGEG